MSHTTESYSMSHTESDSLGHRRIINEPYPRIVSFFQYFDNTSMLCYLMIFQILLNLGIFTVVKELKNILQNLELAHTKGKVFSNLLLIPCFGHLNYLGENNYSLFSHYLTFKLHLLKTHLVSSRTVIVKPITSSFLFIVTHTTHFHNTFFAFLRKGIFLAKKPRIVLRQ